jgi:hypothetical protein
MPGFNGTGPSGRGPMTGGARGWCNPVGARYAGYRPRGLMRPLFGGYRSFWGLRRPFWGVGRGLFGGRSFGGRGIRGWVGRGRRMW